MGSKLLSGSLLRLVNLFTAAISALLLMPFIVHHIGDRLYGFWTLAAAFIGYYGLLDFGLSGAISQYMGVAIGQRDTSECSAVFNAALRIQLLIGAAALVVTGILVAAAPWLAHDPKDATLFSRVITILGVNVAFWFPARAYSGVLEAQLRFDVMASLGILGTVLRSTLIVFAILRGGGLLSLAWMTLLASLPVIALQVFLARRHAPWARIDRSPVSRKRISGFFSYSIYTFLAVIGDIFRFQVDSVVIAGLIGLVAVTHYRVASVFTRYYIDIVVSIIGTIQPVMSRLFGQEDNKNLEKVLFFATRISVWLSSFIGAGLIFWGKPFIERWIGPRFQDAYWPLVVLSIAVFIDVSQTPSVVLLFATFKHRFYTYLNCAEGLLNLIVSLCLAKLFGVLGVALGTLIAAVVVRFIAQPFWICKVTGLSYGTYIRFLAETTFRCIALIALVIALSSWGLRPSYPWLIGSAASATALYIAGSWLVVFGKTERQQLLALISSRSKALTELSVRPSFR